MIWIVFEGPDRSGKTTQIQMAHDWLKQRGFSVVKFNDPSSEVAGDIRQMLLRDIEFHSITDLLLYVAARSELYYKKIIPNQDADVILCDRYLLSTLVYQKVLTPEKIVDIHKQLGLLDIKPDHYLIYASKKPFLGLSENRRDEVYEKMFEEIRMRYMQMPVYTGSRYDIHQFSDESPEEIFENFTKIKIMNSLGVS